ncbi:MAG: hypothetical protein PHT07_15375 [Paludibacter sp.]|nr:hypothetical protein [Paludibacter sp.]
MNKPEFLKGDKGLLLATFAGLILSDLIPGPGDAIYFHYNKKWRDQWAKGELTSRQYWTRETLAYYFFNSGWWTLVAIATLSTPGKLENKLKTLLALTGAGFVAGVLIKNIKSDEAEKLAEKNLAKEKLYTQTNGKTT